MAYANHRFCWHGIISTKPERAQAFYPEVLGWQVQTTPMGEDTATMFAAADGIPRAHLMAPPMEGVPSHWENYLRVEDVDAATARAIENGGTQIVPPTDIPVGRFSVVASPSGATVSLFHEGEGDSQNPPAADGAIHWTELHSTDLAADVAWLEGTFGFTTQEMPIPNGTYHTLHFDGQPIGGAMNSMNPQAPAMWLSWVQVPDVDDTLSRVTAHGGQLLGEAMDMPGIGRMCVVQDPTGGVFGVITPAQR